MDDKKFMREMNNVVEYAIGFLDGTERGKTNLLKNLGEELSVMVGEYIDSSARVNPAELQHVYEWYATGGPQARLFDIDYVVKGLSMNATLTQSSTVKSGSTVPFYNKAKIMEYGIPVTIKPKNSNVLAFDQNGETIFTKAPIHVTHPGGSAAQGGFEEAFKQFFMSYVSQSLLSVSGLEQNLRNPVDFKSNLNAGKLGGRSVGIRVGYNWISRKAQ
jgi:hypothetical protein